MDRKIRQCNDLENSKNLVMVKFMVKIRNSLNNRSLAFSDGELVHLRPKLWQKEKKMLRIKEKKKMLGKKILNEGIRMVPRQDRLSNIQERVNL